VNPVTKYVLRAVLTAASAFLIKRLVDRLDDRVATRRA
jgi:hypothetical protein